MKRFLSATVLLLVIVAGYKVQAKSTEDHSHYLQKILLVVDVADVGPRLRDENAMKVQAHLYTPRVDTLVSSPMMPTLKTLSKEKELTELAAQNQVDGILVISDLTTETQDVELCPDHRGQDTLSYIVDTLTTRCPIVKVPSLGCVARLYGVTPYQEVWRSDVSSEGTAKKPKTVEKLFDEIAIKIFKDIQRHKLIPPSRYQNM